MDEIRYMISDAAKKVAVEAHVLRYWEEELELPIARTELGHRYYTEENIRIFQNIKELKERGFQLKAIKLLLGEIEKKEIKNTDNIIHLEEKLNKKALEKEEIDRAMEEDVIIMSDGSMNDADRNTGANSDTEEHPQNDSSEQKEEKEKAGECESDIVETPLADFEINVDKLVQFEKIVGSIVVAALKENNKELNGQITDSVIKEMDYIMRMKEEKEEERYRRLDETIRAHQKNKKFVAASKSDDVKSGKKGFLFWKR